MTPYRISASASARRLRLPDGRWLGYAEYGDPHGKPVLSFHGGMSSRLDVAFAGPLCEATNVRLIAVDRPGIGSSDYQPNRTLLDWPDDVRHLAAALALKRFAVFGWSGGGPYVLACAFAIPHLLTRAGTSGGMAPVDRHGAVRELGFRLDRILFPLARHSPQLAAVLLTAVRTLPPALLRWSLQQEVSEADRHVIASLSSAEATAFVYEALRPGARGTVADYRVMGGPWGFDLAAITMEILLWQGEQDRLVPMSHAEFLAQHLPHGRLIVVPGRGHFLLRTEMSTIIEALVA